MAESSATSAGRCQAQRRQLWLDGGQPSATLQPVEKSPRSEPFRELEELFVGRSALDLRVHEGFVHASTSGHEANALLLVIRRDPERLELRNRFFELHNCPIDLPLTPEKLGVELSHHDAFEPALQFFENQPGLVDFALGFAEGSGRQMYSSARGQSPPTNIGGLWFGGGVVQQVTNQPAGFVESRRLIQKLREVQARRAESPAAQRRDFAVGRESPLGVAGNL